MAIIINSSFAGKKRSQRGILGSWYERELKALPIIGTSCKKRASGGH